MFSDFILYVYFICTYIICFLYYFVCIYPYYKKLFISNIAIAAKIMYGGTIIYSLSITGHLTCSKSIYKTPSTQESISQGWAI